MKRFIDLIVSAMTVVCLMPGGGASQTKSIVIGEGVRGAMYMPAYIAEEKGYFKKRDLDSKIVTFTRSNDINALVSGDIQFDQTSPDKVIHSALGGFPVKIVMATTRGLNLALVVQPSIKSAADLRGKTVAITSFSGQPYTGLLLCLKELGLTKEQVVPLNIGGKAARFEALVNKKVAAAILDPPYTTMAAKEGFKLIVDLTPLDVPYLRNIVAVSERSLREEPRMISKFVEALAEGMLFYRNNSNKEENILILAKYLRIPLDKNRAMVEEGLFRRFPVDAVYGLHNWPGLEEGRIAVRAGPIMAACDLFEIEVNGRGCHGGMPHLGSDVIVAAASLLSALQTVVSRSVDPLQSAVLSVTQFHAGETWNVLPERAVLRGTTRAFSPAVQDALESAIRRIATHVAKAHDCTARVDYRRQYPATINSAEESERAARSAMTVVGPERVVRTADPSMGAEDFAYMLAERPGCYVWLGSGRGQPGPGLHHPRYDFNDRILPIGASYWVVLVEQELS